MINEFVAIDVETANPDMSSICQVGLAKFTEGKIDDEWKSYVDPKDYFHPINISIHGIDKSTIKGAPTLDEIHEKLCSFLESQIVVCHTHFDRVSIQQAFEKNKLMNPNCTWLDSARVARRTWEEFAWRGYGLGNICEKIGYEFLHHDALEDAKAAGNIILAAIDESGLDLEGWLKRVKKPIDPSFSDIKRDGNPEGPLYGEVLVFTGTLDLSRSEAANIAAQIGCQVDPGVNKKTTILVVGDQDIKKLAGHKKSSKHRKAEQLISKGHSIRIICENDFKSLTQLKD